MPLSGTLGKRWRHSFLRKCLASSFFPGLTTRATESPSPGVISLLNAGNFWIKWIKSGKSKLEAADHDSSRRHQQFQKTSRVSSVRNPAFGNSKSGFWQLQIRLLATPNPAFGNSESGFWQLRIRPLATPNPAFGNSESGFWQLRIRLLATPNPAFGNSESGFWQLRIRLSVTPNPAFGNSKSGYL